MMRTTLDIDSALLDKVVDATGEKTKSAAVNAALKEYIQRKNIQEFIDSWGKIVIDDYSKEVEEANRKRHEFLDSIGRDSD